MGYSKVFGENHQSLSVFLLLTSSFLGLNNKVSITKNTEQLVLGVKVYILAFTELWVILTF